MQPEEILQAVQQGHLESFEGIDPQQSMLTSGYLSVGSLTAIPVTEVSPFIDQSQDTEILDPDGTSIGTVCYVKSRGPLPVGQLTRWQFVAFLADATFGDCAATEYSFRSHYLVLESASIDVYLSSYRASAPIWGSFSHSSAPDPEVRLLRDQVQITRDIVLPTSHHEEALRRYVRSANTYDRYLRLYHCLELLFDYILFAKIKQLGDNLQGFAALMSDYSRIETDRLKSIVREFQKSPHCIAELLCRSKAFSVLREDIFVKYGKASNPVVEDKWAKLKSCIDQDQYDYGSWKRVGLVKDERAYAQLVADIAAYWIYRVRSSIAHNRIGEYLLQDHDAEFVRQFAEPLLLEVVKQVLSSEQIRNLRS
ncbi:hypothetical protein [Cereibacter johrii]|uniref:hypothetical protein n=1 Tax=Cereibacter johrii TaxID=445629 RepID=UPI003CF05EE3